MVVSDAVRTALVTIVVQTHTRMNTALNAIMSFSLLMLHSFNLNNQQDITPMNKKEAKDTIRKHCGPPEFTKGESRLYEAIAQQTRSLPGKDHLTTHIEDSKCPSSITSLSRAARLCEDRVKRGIKKFQNKGLLVIHIGTGFKGKDEYTALPAGLLTRPQLKTSKPKTGAERMKKYREGINKQLAELAALKLRLQIKEGK